MAGIQVADTDGEKWIVYPGDPAHGAVKKLVSLDWTPRLPASFLATGRVFPEAITEALADLEALEDDYDELVLAANDTYRQLRFINGEE